MTVTASPAPGQRHIAVCLGMSWWKRRRVADFLAGTQARPVFRRRVAGAVRAAAARGGAIGVWATRVPAGLGNAAAAAGVPLVRIEDGFIRSVGLGADFLPPLSLVFDRTGIYFDPRHAGDLERLLREGEFDAALLRRARRLIDRIVTGGVTKYNLDHKSSGPSIAWPTGRRRILVPGQVEDDLSLRLGAGRICTNLALLQEVRAGNPDAFIAYKPHPDVVAGHRRGVVREREALRYADVVVRHDSIATLLSEIEELHTMTSLSGFEALLRGVAATAYGRPFYAGWGLTVDREPIDRGRRLTLEQLAAGALILYPRYFDPLSRCLCDPETVIDRLLERPPRRRRPLTAARRLQGRLATLLRPCAQASGRS